jgi:hypothetical protein
MNIKELAKKSGLTESNNDGIRIETGYWVEELTRFAALVAAHEREECIKEIERLLSEIESQLIESTATKKFVTKTASFVSEGIIEAIRARGTR